MDYREPKVGDRIRYTGHDFGIKQNNYGTVVYTEKQRVLMKFDVPHKRMHYGNCEYYHSENKDCWWTTNNWVFAEQDLLIVFDKGDDANEA